MGDDNATTHRRVHDHVEVECNPGFAMFGSVLDCEPYYFNHALTSQPVTLFYDGHVSLVGAHEAMLADRRHDNQFGYGLWSRDTPFGQNGYFIDIGYDFAETSFHIYTPPTEPWDATFWARNKTRKRSYSAPARLACSGRLSRLSVGGAAEGRSCRHAWVRSNEIEPWVISHARVGRGFE